MVSFNHFNFNVLNLERSLKFYREALCLEVVREIRAPDGSFVLNFLGDSAKSAFSLELTWLAGRTQPYDLGEVEYHLAFAAPDFEKVKAKHRDMGIICFENEQLGVYFIEDPDGYWIEIIPDRS